MTKKENSKLQKMRSGHPVIWAFQAIPEQTGVIRKMRDMLQAWKNPGQKIIPATVLSAFDLAWPVRIDQKTREKLLKQSAQKICHFFQEMEIDTEDVQLLPSESLSLREMAKTLVMFAKRAKAEVIIIGSGAGDRSTASGLGSFSEATIAISPVPVVVLGTEATVPLQIKKIFFPTDLSPDSKEIFQKVIELAQKFGAEIILFHHFDLQMGPLMLGPYGLGVDARWLDMAWNHQKKVSEDTGRRWEQKARKAGVFCTYVVDYQFDSLNDRMLAICEQSQADIIAAGIKRGPWSQMIFGNVIRNLFAKAPCPVIVIHSAIKRK